MKNWSTKHKLTECRGCKSDKKRHKTGGHCEKCAYQNNKDFKAKCKAKMDKYTDKNREAIYKKNNERYRLSTLTNKK